LISDSSNVRVHATAIIEPGVTLAAGTSVWDCVHIRHGATLGEECIVGEKTYIAYDVKIGNRVKLNAMVYICYGVTIEDGVMISAGTVFTNDVFPRATTPDLKQLRSSDPDEETQETVVAAGATIGAGCTIGSNLRIGRFAMVGMGSVVTRDVPDFNLVVGNPARSIGAVCRCGHPIARWPAAAPPAQLSSECSKCGRGYEIAGGHVVESTVSRVLASS
jgi:acetyltransferase-like isoleucine patch superfamily enzyme